MSSGCQVKTCAGGATTDATTSKSYINFVTIVTNLTADVLVLIKDGNGGTTIWGARCPGTEDCKHIPFPKPIRVTAGISVIVTGAGSEVYVGYSR